MIVWYRLAECRLVRYSILLNAYCTPVEELSARERVGYCQRIVDVGDNVLVPRIVNDEGTDRGRGLLESLANRAWLDRVWIPCVEPCEIVGQTRADIVDDPGPAIVEIAELDIQLEYGYGVRVGSESALSLLTKTERRRER